MALAVLAVAAAGLPWLEPREADVLVQAEPPYRAEQPAGAELPLQRERIEAGALRRDALPATAPVALSVDRGDPNGFRVRLLDTRGRPRPGMRLRAHVHGFVWHGDATCDAEGFATFPPARGLMVRLQPLDAGDEDWQVELGSATYAVTELRFDPPAAVPDGTR